MKITRTLLTTLALSLIAGLTACSTIDMPKGSSAGYSSYRLFKEVPTESQTFANQGNSALLRVESEIQRILQEGGLEQQAAEADLLVSYLIIVQSNAVSTTIDDYYAQSSSEILAKAHKEVTVKNSFPADFQAGTLVIDIVDLKTEKLIYRNYASNEVIPGLSPEERKQRITQAVEKTLAGFVK
ncbi:DUF4136 domain-containing protein [Coraliomargarita akajimensis]|uniref:DUF4136 domain-containing protein n=1 Tax=Coraliomargarita akajimensis (strain DSM 45221 / IAM 15411 / JCM 23193 / KCTC 12865 / 04OKA010-24) TaxID=583355 RepID=D5EJF8_CORAD|nr:DUF4136 domain-containing protein [Coraliomargarita akajimensis]ADE54557.1 hypothetical protein Caka_1538 [Coraliomargarita akajimensis DSM 45221]